MNWKNVLKNLSLPFVLVILTAVYFLFWKIFDLPTGQELIKIITDFFNKYGYWMVFICSILEGALVIGNYFPGGMVIFLGVVSAGDNVIKIILTVAVVILGFFIGYGIDYLLGKYGWYRLLVKFGMEKQIQDAQNKVAKHQLKAILFSYWEPNLGSITATAAGILKVNFNKFLLESAFGLLIWDAIWGIIVSSLGEKALNLTTNKSYFAFAILIWVLVVILMEFIKSKKGLKENK